MALLSGLLAVCPDEWRKFVDICGYLDKNVEPVKDLCPYSEFACISRLDEGMECREQCPIGFIFAQYMLWREMVRGGFAHEARHLLGLLSYTRHWLPEACQGTGGADGCSPVLIAGWYDHAVDAVDEMFNVLIPQVIFKIPSRDARKGRGRSIAVVTAYYASPVSLGESRWEHYRDNISDHSDDAPYRWFLENKRCYAEAHGYEFVFNRGPPRIDLRSSVDGYRYDIHWVKLSAVRDALSSYDWIFWIDYDALFANFTQTLDEFIDEVEKHPSIDLIVQHGLELMPAYAFLLRSTSWSHRFLDQWESFGKQVVPARSRMWELRCFSCAVVHFTLLELTGIEGLRVCHESAAHVTLLRHILESRGLDYTVRQQRGAVGKIYFWDPTIRVPRGFLFNPNNKTQQAFFPGYELYHVGDLALHLPTPDKGADSMRLFANELSGQQGCSRWTQPRATLLEAYQPLPHGESPGYFRPQDVVRVIALNFSPRRAIVRADGLEAMHVLQGLLMWGAGEDGKGWSRVDMMVGRSITTVEENLIYDVDTAHVTAVSLVGDIARLPLHPMNVLYDFIYVGAPLAVHGVGIPDFSPSSLNATALRAAQELEVLAAVARVQFASVVAVHVEGCGSSDIATPSELFFGLNGFKYTRAKMNEPDETGPLSNCVWAYFVKGSPTPAEYWASEGIRK